MIQYINDHHLTNHKPTSLSFRAQRSVVEKSLTTQPTKHHQHTNNPNIITHYLQSLTPKT